MDLTGEWKGSSAYAVFSAKTTKGGVDSYRVSVTQDGRSVQGTAAFDGQRLSLVGDALVGFVHALDSECGGGCVEHRSYDYMRDTGVDRLLSGAGDLERARPSALPVWRSPSEASSGSWGGRAQLGATIHQLDDLESGKVSTGNWFTRNPVVAKVLDWFQPGRKNDEKRLRRFLVQRELWWGQPTTDLPRGAVKGYDLFRAQKAIALARFGRTPAEVTEGFVDARGSVDGQKIADRKIFWQRWKPIGKPSGRLVVISPGFQETGRNFYEQIQFMNKEGDDVIVMDHQWAGYSQGEPGGLDRGFGVARDVAAVAAFAHEAFPNEKLVLFGNSMGAGPGALGAATLTDAGLMQLDGPQMPRGTPVVLQAPFIEMRGSITNYVFAGVSHLPWVRGFELPSLGLPTLTHDGEAAAAFANHAAAEDVRAQSRTMTAANADIARIMQLVKEGKGPTGRVYVLHEKADPLADPAGSQKLLSDLRANSRRTWLDLFDGNDHVLEENPSQNRRFLPGISWATLR